MTATLKIEALALMEIDGLPHALLAHDTALKKPPVRVFACTPTSPGKSILLFGGDVASCQMSLNAAIEVVASRLIDRLFLPGVHEEVLQALMGGRRPRHNEALGVYELSTVAAGLEAADAAVKSAQVLIGRLHPASGFGGKAYFTLFGQQSDVEAASLSISAIAKERLLDQVVIPAPHDELGSAALTRPWPIDPADRWE